MGQRKIIHIDMDAFYASIEQRDQPALRGRPVIVGGLPNSRGVVATCSYEARKFGIHSALASKVAYHRCPQAVFIRPDMEKYRRVSAQIMGIFRSISELVEPLSLDEAFLDVTENELGLSSATLIAKEIRRRIFHETKLTASAGVSFNKFLAKTASGYRKPGGLTVVPPEEAQSFIDRLPIGDFFGVGRVTEEKMKQLGVYTGRDLRAYSEQQLVELFQERGKVLYRQARGIDDRPVVPNRKRKSLGKETTLAENLTQEADMLAVLEQLTEQVCQRLKQYDAAARSVSIKVKFSDFQQITRQKNMPIPSADPRTIMEPVQQLLRRVDLQKPVRLLGVSTSDFVSSAEQAASNEGNNRDLRSSPLQTEPAYVQLSMWDDDAFLP